MHIRIAPLRQRINNNEKIETKLKQLNVVCLVQVYFICMNSRGQKTHIGLQCAGIRLSYAKRCQHHHFGNKIMKIIIQKTEQHVLCLSTYH